MRLTATTIRTLRLPRGARDKVFFDADLPGFGLRLRDSGVQAWLVQYAVAGRTRRITLGSPATLDPGKAREAAKRILAATKLGKDPAADKQAARAQAAETFGALLPRFLERQRLRMKPRSFEETNRHLTAHARLFHTLPVTSLDRRTIAIRLSELGAGRGPAAANRVRTSLSAFCTWLAREGYIEANPVAFTNKAIENGARDRVLVDAEIAAIWRALGEDQYGGIVRLLLLTGARRDEIASLRWSEVDFADAVITLPGERIKNRREHVIPLSESALAILRSLPQRVDADGSSREHVFGNGTGRGFQNWSGSKADLDDKIARDGQPVGSWTLHDFRRSISTWLHEAGVAPHVVEVLLGHAGGHRAGVAGTYNKAEYLPERRRALQLWADHLTAITTGKSAKGKVVELRRRRKSR
jgi:integrase